jgi:hypothetical protein
MPEEEYFEVVAEVNSAYLKSITNSMKPCFLSNLVYYLDIASGNNSPNEGYIIAELRHSKCSYAIN